MTTGGSWEGLSLLLSWGYAWQLAMFPPIANLSLWAILVYWLHRFLDCLLCFEPLLDRENPQKWAVVDGYPSTQAWPGIALNSPALDTWLQINTTTAAELKATSSLKALPVHFPVLRAASLPCPFLRCDLPWLSTCWVPFSALFLSHLFLPPCIMVTCGLAPFLSFAESSLRFGTICLHVCFFNVCLCSFMVL